MYCKVNISPAFPIVKIMVIGQADGTGRESAAG